MIEAVLSIIAVACAVGIPIWFNRRWESRTENLISRARELVDEYVSRFEQKIDYYATNFEQLYITEKAQFMEALPTLADTLGETIFRKVAGSLGGKASGDVRLEQSVQRAIGEDMLNLENPLVGAVLDQFPTLKKLVVSNPRVVPIVLSYIQQLSAGGAGQQGRPVQGNRTRYRYGER